MIQFIYESFLYNTPFYKIREEAKAMGFPFTSNRYLQKILSLPIYSGQQWVKPWREMPGGLFPANHEALIDMFTWQQVQRKIKGEPKTRVTVSDEMPLRGVLHCHCSRLLTGAPSKSRNGNLFYYYKCHTSREHSHIAAKKVHSQVNEMLSYLSLPSYNRWQTTYNQQRITLLAEIEKYSADRNEMFFVVNNNL